MKKITIRDLNQDRLTQTLISVCDKSIEVEVSASTGIILYNVVRYGKSVLYTTLVHEAIDCYNSPMKENPDLT